MGKQPAPNTQQSPGLYGKTGSALRGVQVQGPRTFGTPGSAKSPSAPKITAPKLPETPAITGPESPALPPIEPVGEERTEHAELRDRYTGFGEDLKEGTGFAMDVLTGAQTDRMEAQIEQAREQAAALGIPFDEASYRAELQRGVNAAMAEEKLGREGLYQEHLATTAPITAGADYAQAEKGIDLERDVAEQEGVLDRYGTDVGKYGYELQAATRANEMLMDFYKSLMTGYGTSFTGGNVTFA
jgi:hypothetical protein